MLKFFASSLIFLICAIATMSHAHAQARFSILEDGKEVFDSQTGLKWQRCTQGQDWDGTTCFGSPITKNFEVLQASLKVKPKGSVKESGSDIKWRIPTEKELASLIDKKFKDRKSVV